MTGFGYRPKKFDNRHYMHCRRQQGKDRMCVGDLEMCCCRSDIRLLVLTDRLAAGLWRRHLLGAALITHTAATRMLLSFQKLPRNEASHRWHSDKRQQGYQGREFAANLHRLTLYSVF
jgi:hypothetical protein